MKIRCITILFLVGAMITRTGATAPACQDNFKCSPQIRLASPARIDAKKSGLVYIQACRQGDVHYLAFTILPGMTPAKAGRAHAQDKVHILFQIDTASLEALGEAVVNSISISFNSASYTFTLDRNEGVRLRRLCALLR